MVTMKDIASKCGVSVATVSKALNNKSDIGEETRQKICAIADEMGYFTNSAARSLKTNRTYIVGVLFVDEQNSGLTHQYFSSVLDSFKVAAEERGYDITFINHNVGSKPTTYLQHCYYRDLDGVVIACVDFNDPQVIELVNSEVPVVTIDHVFNNHTAILSNNVSGMNDLLEYVYQKGHRKIAVIRGEKQASVTNFRLSSFYRTCQRLNLEIPEEYDRQGAYNDPKRCYDETMELLKLPDRPTCIFFQDDFSALGGINAITEMGLKIPEDISVVGYDGITLSQVITPKLTTYRQATTEIGRMAAEQLIDEIEHPKISIPEHHTIKGKLIPGESVKDLTV